MLKSGLEGGNEARTHTHTFLVGNFKQQEDLEMHSRLPYRGDFQRYDLGIETILS